MKRKRSLSTVVTLILSLVLVLNTTALADDVEVKKDPSLYKDSLLEPEVKIDKDLVKGKLKKTDEVRVIVELKEEAIIEKATKQGKKIEELKPSDVKREQEKLTEKQEEVIENIEEENVQLDVHNQYTNVLNGFSTTVEYEDVEKIADDPTVEKVYLANEYKIPEGLKPNMIESSQITQSKFVNENYGYSGKDMVVAIIDSGIDVEHKDMRLDDDVTGKLTEDSVKNIIKEKGLKGKFYTSKVPYGCNYMDSGSDEIKDNSTNPIMHGMHVAGIVAANKEYSEGIDGVAPNAQLLALKVFGNDPEHPTAHGDILIAAIDDAIALKADVINISIGSPASFVDENDPEQKAIQRAVDNGIQVSATAGNEGYFGYAQQQFPKAENPDIGVVGHPGVTSAALQIASVYNNITIYDTTYKVDGTDIKFNGYGSDKWGKKSYEVVAVGGSLFGHPDDYKGIDVKGKVVLIKRGELIYQDKIEIAHSNGASGIIVYDRGIGEIIGKNTGRFGVGIPFALISHADGQKLVDELTKQNGNIKISVTEWINSVDPIAGKIAESSSWGTTPSLDFKPDMTAPGANIYSTLNNNKYGHMSGTSMAAPHVAGGAALVLEKIKKDDIFGASKLTAKKRIQLANNILMNTAVPVKDTDHKSYESPRRQGAGVMNLKYAIDTDVIVTNEKTGLAKVNLSEFNTNKVKFNLRVRNYGSKKALYKLNGYMGTNASEKGLNLLYSKPVKADFTYLVEGKPVKDFLIIEPKEELILEVKAKIDDNDIAKLKKEFVNGNFLEGFVFFDTSEDMYAKYIKSQKGEDYNTTSQAITTDSTTDQAIQIEVEEMMKEFKSIPLSVPYIGFYGDWSLADGFDKPIYDEESFYGLTKLVDENSVILGSMTTEGGKDVTKLNVDDNSNVGTMNVEVVKEVYSADKIAFSPNQDGERDLVYPIISVLRNMKDIKYQILDSDKNVIRTLGLVDEAIKHYLARKEDSDKVTVSPEYHWDGTAKLKPVPDGQYYYRISGTLADSDKTVKSLDIPVKVDREAPIIESISIENNKIKINASDKGVGIKSYLIYDKAQEADVQYSEKPVFNLNELKAYKDTNSLLDVIVEDYAGNKTRYNKPIRMEAPYVEFNIEPFESINSKEVVVEGIVDTKNDPTLKIDSEKIELTYDEQAKIYRFKKTFKYDSDGKKAIKVEAKDSIGNKINFVRHIYIDSTKPVISTNLDSFNLKADIVNYVKPDFDSIDFKATISDNFPELTVKYMGDIIHENKGQELSILKSIKESRFKFDDSIKLDYGENIIQVRAYDITGNKEVLHYVVYRLKDGENAPEKEQKVTIPEESIIEDSSLVQGIVIE